MRLIMFFKTGLLFYYFHASQDEVYHVPHLVITRGFFMKLYVSLQ